MNELGRLKAQEMQTQLTPLWDRLRDRPTKNHHTSIDRAVDAHRERVHERRERIQKDLGYEPNMMNRYYQGPVVAMSVDSEVAVDDQNQDANNSLAAIQANPMVNVDSELEYKEDMIEDLKKATLKQAPPVPAEVPKGSYIDLEA